MNVACMLRSVDHPSVWHRAAHIFVYVLSLASRALQTAVLLHGAVAAGLDHDRHPAPVLPAPAPLVPRRAADAAVAHVLAAAVAGRHWFLRRAVRGGRRQVVRALLARWTACLGVVLRYSCPAFCLDVSVCLISCSLDLFIAPQLHATAIVSYSAQTHTYTYI